MNHIIPTTLVLALIGSVPAAAQESEVKLEKIKYDQLGKTIRDLKGKVVVVDFWATY